MLAIDDGTEIAWRAVEGSCADGIAPLIERSSDAGVTWTDVTPTYRDVRQVLALDTFAGNQAQAVVLLGTGCTVDGLRTFTQGRFWESYDEVLSESVYADPENSATINTPSGAIAAPCADPRNVRALGERVLLICDSDLHTFVDGEWVAEGLTGVVAAAVDTEGSAVVSRSSDCEGLLLAVTEGQPPPTVCFAAADPSEATAAGLVGNKAWLWDGANTIAATVER